MDIVKKVLVTGAGGYIGRHVVTALLDLGVNVIAIDSKTENIDIRANAIEYNLFADHPNIFKELGEPDVCLHMAWRDGFVHNSDAHLQYLFSHYEFIRRLVEGGLKHVVVMGTMHEVGYYEGGINESTPTNPTSLYGIAKNSLRQSLEALLKNTDVVFQWLRAFYIYGDDIKSRSIFSKIIEAEHANQDMFPFTTGSNKYDFISVDELAKQIALSSVQTSVTGIVNCCSGVPVTLREMVEQFICKNKFRIKLDYGAFPDRPYDSPAIWGDSTKIKKIVQNFEKQNEKA